MLNVIEGADPQIHHQNPPKQQHNTGSVLFIALQYFQQGITSYLPQSFILTYPNIPSYQVLSLFEGAKISLGLKFIFAPFLEIYTNVFYGKRKFWMILSGVMMAVFILVVSFFTTQNYQIIAALILTFASLFSSISDIATDGCSLKDLRNPVKMSFIQATSRRVGTVVGGFVFLKLVLPTFGKWIGLPGSVTNISTFLKILALFFIVGQIVGHFLYKEQILPQEIERKDDSIWKIIKQYKAFFELRNKYFRTGLLLFLSLQGLLFFKSSYQIELMKKGFSKQTMNDIVTASSFPILIFVYFFSKLASQQNMYRLLGIIISLRFVNYIIAYVFQPSGTIPVIAYLFIEQSLTQLYDVIVTVIANYFPVTAISAMMITMLNCCTNAGNFASFHLLIVGAIGHRTASMIGFILHAIFMIFVYQKMVKWVKQGEIDHHQETHEDQIFDDKIHNIFEELKKSVIKEQAKQDQHQRKIKQSRKKFHASSKSIPP